MQRLEEQFVEKLSYKLIARKKGLPNLCGILQKMEASQFFSKDALHRLQEQRMKRLLVHAFENTSFYHKRFIDFDFDPSRFLGIDDLKKFRC